MENEKNIIVEEENKLEEIAEDTVGDSESALEVVEEAEVADQKEETSEEFVKAKPTVYTDKKGLQILAGIVSSIAIWVTLTLGSGKEGLISWLWVIIFGIVFIGKNQIEKKKNIFFKFFTMSMLYSLIALMAISALLYFLFPGIFSFAGIE